MFIKSIALAELVAYIEQLRMDEDVAPVFKLADLGRLYSERVKKLGVEEVTRTHTNELKNRIFPTSRTLQLTKKGAMYSLPST